jgi:hypothetical protein
MLSMAALGPYSTHLTRLENLDGRGREARMLKSFRKEFTAALGHKPNAVETAMIENLCWLQLRLLVMDKRITDGEFSRFDADVYNAHANSIARIADKLGLIGAKPTVAAPDPMSALRSHLTPPVA